MNVYKSKEKRIFEIVHWPLVLPTNQQRPTGPFSWHKWCSLARPSKGQCTISKILSSLIFSLFIEQNIFFPETCFAYTISEPKFTVCKCQVINVSLSLSSSRQEQKTGNGVSRKSALCRKKNCPFLELNWFTVSAVIERRRSIYF